MVGGRFGGDLGKKESEGVAGIYLQPHQFRGQHYAQCKQPLLSIPPEPNIISPSSPLQFTTLHNTTKHTKNCSIDDKCTSNALPAMRHSNCLSATVFVNPPQIFPQFRTFLIPFHTSSLMHYMRAHVDGLCIFHIIVDYLKLLFFPLHYHLVS